MGCFSYSVTAKGASTAWLINHLLHCPQRYVLTSLSVTPSGHGPPRLLSLPASCKGRKVSRIAGATVPQRHTPVARPGCGRGGLHGARLRWQTDGEGDSVANYKQVTEDIREGLAKINKEGKSIEIIMKEILVVLTNTCERHKLDKFEFIQAFYEWYKEKR
jgi:hypothetical protein